MLAPLNCHEKQSPRCNRIKWKIYSFRGEYSMASLPSSCSTWNLHHQVDLNQAKKIPECFIQFCKLKPGNMFKLKSRQAFEQKLAPMWAPWKLSWHTNSPMQRNQLKNLHLPRWLLHGKYATFGLTTDFQSSGWAQPSDKYSQKLKQPCPNVSPLKCHETQTLRCNSIKWRTYSIKVVTPWQAYQVQVT